MADVFYSPLSTVITLGEIPEKLNFISDAFETMLNRIYFRNLQVNNSSSNKSGTFYELDLVSFSEILRIEIPGTGLALILNPDLETEEPNSDYSVIPISLYWKWDILNYISSFKLSAFGFSPNSFFNLLLQVINHSDKELFIGILDFCLTETDYSEEEQDLEDSPVPGPIPSQSFTPTYDYLPDTETGSLFLLELGQLEQFVTDAKAKYSSLAITQPLNSNPEIAYSDIRDAFTTEGVDIFTALFDLYIFDDTSLDNTLSQVSGVFSSFLGNDAIGFIKDLLIPQITATAQLSAGLEIPRSALLPLNLNNEIIPGDIKTRLIFDAGEFYFDSKAGFGFEETLALSFHPDTPKAQIANTGLIISFTYAKLDASTTSNIPEADVAGYPVDFVGLYVQHATIEFGKFGQPNPANTSAAIFADDLLIGTGGVSGTIGLEANGKLYRKFGNFAVELNAFSLSFRQNSITGSYIAGKLTIPKFTASGGGLAEIAIEAAIRDNGDFTIRALPQAEPYTITFPEVFELKVRSAAAGSVDGNYYVSISGQLSFIADIPFLGDILPKNIELTKLLIWDDGRIDFEGGSFKVPKTFRLHIGPVNMEVGNIAFGAYQRKLGGVERSYRYFSFDGMVNTGRAGINTTGNGLKYYFTVDDLELDHFISIDRLEIDLAIPGNDREKAAFLLNGFLSVSNPTQVGSVGNTEYTGSVAFSLPKLKIAGSAGMRLNPGVPAFVVDVGMDLPSAAPLGGTGLGIYSLRGLLAQHYLPSKSAVTPPLPETASWLDYYNAPPKGAGISKFANEPGFSVGAGMSLGTIFDSGWTFSSKLFILLGLPNTFIIEGQAGMLRKRIALNDDVDPPFRALIVFGDHAVRGNLSVNFNLPDDGRIFKLQGALDMAFFFNNASGWYLNIGKDQPESAQVRADILTLFKGHAFLMLSSRGIKAGAGIKFDFKKDFGPVSVGLGAFLNLGGFVTFKPVQIGGYIQVGGYAYLKVWKFKIGLSVAISLAVEAPHPFNIVGSLEVSVKVIFKRIRFKLEMSWHFNNDTTIIRSAQPLLQLPEESGGTMPAGAVNILSNESFSINYVLGNDIDVIPAPGQGTWKYDFENPEDARKVTIPLDSFIDIELLKPVKPGAIPLGGAANQLPIGYSELIPPQKGVSKQIKHEYEITGLEIYSWNNSSWVPYDVYKAVSAIVEANTGTGAINLDSLKPGYWQFMEPGKFNKIRLLSQHMFSYGAGQPLDENALDDKNFGKKDVFCFESVWEEQLINWKSIPADTGYPVELPFYINNFKFTLVGNIAAKVDYREGYSGNSLSLTGYTGSLEINLPQELAYVNLQFRENQHTLKVSFIKTRYVISRKLFRSIVVAIDEPVAIMQAPKNEPSPLLELKDNTVPINKILIEFLTAASPDYEGDLMMGNHYRLPDQYDMGDLPGYYRELETKKALAFVTFYNRSFTESEVVESVNGQLAGAIAKWSMYNNRELYSNRYALINGSPDFTESYYEIDDVNKIQQRRVYTFNVRTDGLKAVYYPNLKIENSSFAFGLTAIFSPFEIGLSTLFSKVKEDPESGFRTGYALHLCRTAVTNPNTTYPDAASIPEYSIWFTCYKESGSWGHQVSDKFTIDCNTSTLSKKQYKAIFVNVNRQSGMLDIYIDRILKAIVTIPAELAAYNPSAAQTWLDQLSYVEQETYSRVVENDMKEERMIEELQVLDNAINKTIQPVWRPDTTYAIKVKTRDVVDGQATPERKHVFGFKTAGPVGHFHQQSEKYQLLKEGDRQDEFKLASLKHYIDYERSFPDAQGRFDRSKPVFFHNPQVRLFFTQPYINAMFENWAAYNGQPAITSSLKLQLLNPSGNPIEQELIWNEPIELPVTPETADILPEDIKALYKLNSAAQQCGSVNLSFTRKIRQGTYEFPDLEANKLYTAVFSGVYGREGEALSTNEIHKFGFISSRYSDFIEQAGSFVLDGTPGEEKYAISKYQTNFSTAEINNRLKLLVNENTADDPADVLRYAEPYDRLIYGGIGFKTPDFPAGTEALLIINSAPDSSGEERLIGILLRNPEPFNEPKYTEELLENTVQLSISTEGNVLPASSFRYIHSGERSAVFITNEAMDIPFGLMQLKLIYKVFDGVGYEQLAEVYDSPAIDLQQYLTS